MERRTVEMQCRVSHSGNAVWPSDHSIRGATCRHTCWAKEAAVAVHRGKGMSRRGWNVKEWGQDMHGRDQSSTQPVVSKLVLLLLLLRVGLNEGECSGVQPVCAVVSSWCRCLTLRIDKLVLMNLGDTNERVRRVLKELRAWERASWLFW